jgi:hypothetical protein
LRNRLLQLHAQRGELPRDDELDHGIEKWKLMVILWSTVTM